MSTDIQVNYANWNGLEKESRSTEQITYRMNGQYGEC